MNTLYTCTLTSDFTDHPKLGVRNHDTKELEGAFYTEKARRLYMAAPDMLEALKAAWDLLPARVPHDPEHVRYAKIRAAIDKATG